MTTDSPSRPSVLVIGGGYGGIVVASGLDEVADVTLVDPRDAFVHNIATLRALVDPEWIDQIFFPYASLLQRGRVIRDRAVAAEPGIVTLASGERVTADYIVLATGSTYPFPANADEYDSADASERHRVAHGELLRAERVLIVGAGPAGLELAGEIKTAMPEKSVTIVEAADDILTGPYMPAVREELRRQLDALGITLQLGTTLRQLPTSAPAEHGAFAVITERGETIEADIWFQCFGGRPVTDYLTGELASVVDAAGNIAVGPDLRVKGQAHVFAIGDIIEMDGKMAAFAGFQGQNVVENIRSIIQGHTELAPYQQMLPAMFIPLGPNGGAGQLPGADEVSGPEVVAQIKGTHMMLDRYRGMFAVTTPAADSSGEDAG